MQIKKAYALFYFEGLDDELDQDDLDIDDLAEKCLDGSDSPYAVVHRAVQTLAAPLEHDREKKDWISDYEEEISAAGGDSSEAWKHFCQGRIDQTAMSVLEEVLDVMDPRNVEDDGDEEDDDEEDDEED